MGVTIKYDEVKNRVYVTAGSVSVIEAEQYNIEFKKLMSTIKRDFTGITDLQGQAILSPEVAQELGKSGEVAVSAGLKDWVYVTKGSIYKLQMKRLFGNFAKQYDTLKEADKYLDTI